VLFSQGWNLSSSIAWNYLQALRLVGADNDPCLRERHSFVEGLIEKRLKRAQRPGHGVAMLSAVATLASQNISKRCYL
jgi:hypothetical protein